MIKKEKKSFMVVGTSICIAGQSVHESRYSQEKTEFYKQLFNEKKMQKLFPYSLDGKGYGVITPCEDGIRYFAGVVSNEKVAGYETLTIPTEKYLVMTSKGKNSRTLFDELEDSFFINKEFGSVEYNGGTILEVLLNGNPADAEVALWIPINQ